MPRDCPKGNLAEKTKERDVVLYIIIGIGLIAACYGGYKYGYRDGVSDTFDLIDGWEKLCEQIQNALKDFDKE